MLHTAQYVCIRRDGSIVCTAGVHVYLPQYRVAALGNIATDPRYRKQGMCRRATAFLCRSLLNHVDTVGLNVKMDKDNVAAIACYQSLGFVAVAEHDEFTATRNDA